MALPNPDLDIIKQEDGDIPAVASDEELEGILRELVKVAEKEEDDIRWPMLQKCKRNNYYFNNLQRCFWDSELRDFRPIEDAVASLLNFQVDDVKTINIYRGFIESIVAALSVQEPNVIFPPEDAENPDDIEAADAHNRIVMLVRKQTESKLKLIRALTLFMNSGFIAAFNYKVQSSEFGTVSVPTGEETVDVKHINSYCPECGTLYGVDEPVPSITCENCGYTGPAEQEESTEQQTRAASWEDVAKSRVNFDVFDQTYVKVPLSARNQSGCGYIGLRIEEHYAKIMETFDLDEPITGSTETSQYERWARVPPEYYGAIPKEQATLRTFWFRKWYYRVLKEEDRALLIAKYPNGCKVAIVDEKVVEHDDERLDDRWTLSFDPRSNFIHSEPAGNAIIPIQDAENDVFNLGLQCIEYGVPETFASPKTLNFKKYSQTKAAPGSVTPATPPGPDKSIADGFHTLKTATLSNEYSAFAENITKKGEFISSALPSIWGGSNPTGDTAQGYQESKANALQRLQLAWEIVSVFWINLFSKLASSYADTLLEDEKFAEKKGGSYINVWIRKTSLSGKVGKVEPETNAQLPQSWGAKRAFIMELFKLQDENIGKILMDPNNAELLKQVTGLVDIYVPGEHDRNKQWSEFHLMSQEGPQGNEPSVPVDIYVDDHPVHMQVLKNILVSPIGLSLDPEAYQNCILHYQKHEFAIQAKMQEQAGLSAPGEMPETAANSTQG